MGIIARLMDIGAGHSRAVQEGYAGMEGYISGRRMTPPIRPTS